MTHNVCVYTLAVLIFLSKLLCVTVAFILESEAKGILIPIKSNFLRWIVSGFIQLFLKLKLHQLNIELIHKNK